MASLGELFYTLSIQDNTASAITEINRKLKNLGSNIQIDAKALLKPIQDHLDNKPAKLKINDTTFQQSVQAALTSIQQQGLDFKANRIALRDSIKDALKDDFYINIKVMRNQAQMAVQNALNNVNQLSTGDWLKIQRATQAGYNKSRMELAELRKAQLQARDAAASHARASVNLNSSMSGNIRVAGELGAAMASIYSVHKIKEFLSNVIEIGGELEHQKIALDTIYGDPGKTQTLFSQIKSLARESPFGVMDLTKNIKQLSAYGVAYNEVYDTAKRLADISAATSVDINRLILAFGKTKNRTFLDGLEAKQFAYANIPIYDALSKKLTELEGKFVSVKDVMKRISKREIGFDLVKDILWDMTDEGGKFYNMQEKLAGSVKTSWKLVRDNIELMFGEIAEGGVGEILKDFAQSLQSLTKNWKSLATVIATSAGAWGISRLAILANNTIIGKHTTSLLANKLAQDKVTASNAQGALSYRLLSREEVYAITRKNALNKLLSQNIFWNQQLTKSEVKSLLIGGQLNRDLALRAIAMGKITPMQGLYLKNQGLISVADLQGALSARKYGDSIKILGKEFQIASFRFKLLRTSLAAGLGNLASMFINPLTAAMAAISGAMYLWQKNTAETELGNDMDKQMKEKAEGMAKAMTEALEKPFKGLSDIQAQNLIDEYKSLIKDYASLPEDLIQKALYDDKGHIRDTADQIKYLREELELLKKAGEAMADKDVIGAAVSASGDGWFKEDAVTNVKDWLKAYSQASGTYQKFVTEHKERAQLMVSTAAANDKAFAKDIENAKNLNEQLAILAHGRDKYLKGWAAAEDAVGYFGIRNAIFGPTVASRSKQEMVDHAKAIAGVRSVAEDIATQMNGADMTLPVNQEIARQYFKEFIERAGATAKEVKEEIEKEFQSVDFFKDVQFIPDETQEKWLREMKMAMGKVTDESTKKAIADLMAQGYSKLPEAEKKLVDAFFENADKDAIKKLRNLGELNQEWLNQHPLEWRINYIAEGEGKQLSQAANDILDNVGGASKVSLSTLEILKEIDGEGQSTYEIRNAMQQKLQDAKNKMDADIKQGLSETSETFKADKEKYDKVLLAIKELEMKGLQTKDQKSNKTDKKDTIAEDFKQRLKDLKDAWNEYKKWEKSVGDEAAAEIVANSGLFGNMKPEDIPRTAEEYQKAIEKIQKELEDAIKKNGSTSQRESLLNDILTQLLSVKKTTVDEQIEKALAIVDQEIERKLEQYNLYEKIRKATGDKDLAYAFSFGIGNEGQTDYVKLIKDNFNRQLDSVRDLLEGEATTLDFDSVNFDNLHLLPAELQKAWKEAVKNIEKYQQEQSQFVADLLDQYKGTQQEIIAIQEQTADAIAKIQKQVAEGKLTPLEGQNLTQQVKVNADFEIFKLSGDYLKFFNATLAMSKREISAIGSKIKENLDKKLQSGVITAQEYCDEMDKINGKLRESEERMSNFVASLKGGLSGGLENAYRQQEAKYNQAATDYDIARQRFNIAATKNDTVGMKNAKAQMTAAQEQMDAASAAMEGMEGMMQTVTVIDTIVHTIDDTVQGIAEAVRSMAEMADSMGVDTSAGSSWGDALAFFDAFSQASAAATKAWDSLKSGNIGGVISGVVQSFTSWFTVFNQYHDAKLQKDIEDSARAFEHLGNVIDIIEGKLQYFLGNRRNLVIDLSADEKQLSRWQDRLSYSSEQGTLLAKYFATKAPKQVEKYQKRIEAYNTGGALGYERQLMTEQLAELERQRQDELNKKKTDYSAVEAYDQQIAEMKQSIKDFAEEMAETVYGINLQDWASQIGDSLVNAFAKGEDAAEAFKDTVADIMRNLVSNMITNDLIAPAMQDLEKWLFGDDGTGGVYGKDFLLDENEAAELGNRLMGLEGVIDNARSLYDSINEAMGGLMDDSDNSSENSVRGGIQSITEDTADLLASYVNSIRAYVAQNWSSMESIVNDAFPRITMIAESQLTQLYMISENTRRNMEASESIQSYSKQIYDTLSKATHSQGSGFYIR